MKRRLLAFAALLALPGCSTEASLAYFAVEMALQAASGISRSSSDPVPTVSIPMPPAEPAGIMQVSAAAGPEASTAMDSSGRCPAAGTRHAPSDGRYVYTGVTRADRRCALARSVT